MKEIKEAYQKIYMTPEARERVLSKKKKRNAALWLVPAMAALLLFFFLPRRPQEEVVLPPTDIVPVSVQAPVSDDIVVNRLEYELEVGTYPFADGIILESEKWLDSLAVPHDMGKPVFYARYTNANILENKDSYGYQFDYANDTRRISVFFSEKLEKRPDCMFNLDEWYEPSTIQNIQARILKGIHNTFILFQKQGYYFDIEGCYMADEELLAFARSLLDVDIHVDPPVLDIYQDVTAKEEVWLERQEPGDLYEEADFVGMIQIYTVDDAILRGKEAYSKGVFHFYHLYKGDNLSAAYRYIRNGAIIDSVQYLHEGDILIEQGKCYLAYLKQIDAKTVEIIGFQEGLRELKEYVPSLDRNKVAFLNNDTGNYEAIAAILPFLEDYGECFVN